MAVVRDGAQDAGPSAGLARFAVQVRWEDVPATLRHEAKRALVNFFGTALAGRGDPAVVTAAALFDELAAARRDCTVIGRAQLSDLLHAASLNAMAGNVFD